MRRPVVLFLSVALGMLALLLVVAAESGTWVLAILAGIFAVVSLVLMLFTDVMFGKHERSEKWDEFLNQPPRPPQE